MQWLANASAKGMKANFMKQLADDNVEINNGWKGTDFYTFIHAMACMEATTPDYATAVKELTALEKKKYQWFRLFESLLCRQRMEKANEKKMLAYYEKGVSLGEPYACFLLAQLHLSGSKTVKVDKNKVVTYLEKAADGDYAPAMCELGDCISQESL